MDSKDTSESGTTPSPPEAIVGGQGIGKEEGPSRSATPHVRLLIPDRNDSGPSTKFKDILSSTTRSTMASWESSGYDDDNENADDSEPIPLSVCAAADRERLFRRHSSQAMALRKDSKWRIVRNYLSVIRAMKTISKSKPSRRRRAKATCVVMPDACIKRMQDIIMLFALLYVAIAQTYIILMEIESSTALDAIDYVIYVVFFCDIILNFFTAYVDSDGYTVTRHRDIAVHYITHWFIVDVVASMPIDLIVGSSDGAFNQVARLARLPRALRLLRLVKLVKLLRIPQVQGRIRRCQIAMNIHPAIGRTIQTIFWAVLILHILACAYHFIAATEEDTYPGMTWISRVEPSIVDESKIVKYLFALYFTFSTFTSVGYGDITPWTPGEMVFTILCMMGGVAWIALVTSNVTAIVTNYDTGYQSVKTVQNRLNQFMRAMKISKGTRRAANAYFSKRARNIDVNRQSFSKSELFDILPPNLSLDILMEMHGPLLRRIPFLMVEPKTVRVAVADKLKIMNVGRREPIGVEQVTPARVYFLCAGTIVMIKGRHIIDVFGTGSVFGLVDTFYSTTQAATFRATSACELYYLLRDDVEHLAETYPTLGIRLRRLAASRLKGYEQKLKRPFLAPPQAFRPAAGVARAIASLHPRRSRGKRRAILHSMSEASDADSLVGYPSLLSPQKQNMLNASEKGSGFFAPRRPILVPSASENAKDAHTGSRGNDTEAKSPAAAHTPGGNDDVLPSSESSSNEESVREVPLMSDGEGLDQRQEIDALKQLAASLMQRLERLR